MQGFITDRRLTLSRVFENSFYKIEADFGRSLARVQWKDAITDDQLCQGALKLHAFMVESGLENLLSNSQALASLSPTTKNWLADQYYEMLSQTNLKKLARITPANLFHQIALESVVTRAVAVKNISYLVRSFQKEADAVLWLQAQ